MEPRLQMLMLTYRMPPRIQPPSKAVASILRCRRPLRNQCHYATAAAIAPATSPEGMAGPPPPKFRYPSTQPPSHKPPEFRKSQLLRQYASLLQSTPLMLIFQHNNLKSLEWSGVRRELTKALRKVDAERAAAGLPEANLADGIKLQVIQSNMFASALRVVEFYKHDATSNTISDDGFTHVLSKTVHDTIANTRTKHPLDPLLSGPLVVLSFPTVTPQHLKAAISILSPSAPQFPAPTRRANEGWHDPPVQAGVKKLLLLGARVEGKVFDVERTKWVGSIEGGLEGLRGQLVAMLQGIGAGVTNTLESAAKNLYFTVESRRSMLEDEEKGVSGEAEAPKEEGKAE